MLKILITLLALNLSFSALAAQAPVLQIAGKNGFEKTPIQSDTESSLDNEVFKYLQQWGLQQEPSMTLTADNLKFTGKKHSLLGEHYNFQFFSNGIEVDGMGITVSLNTNKEVIKLYSSLDERVDQESAFPTPGAGSVMSTQSLAIAWDHLGVQGRLLSQPSVRRIYRTYNGRSELVDVVSIAVTHPAGDWEVDVAVNTRRVMQVQDTRVDGKPHAYQQTRHLPSVSMQASLLQYRQLERDREQDFSPTERVTDGKALVFDPDPRTALMDESLTDNSPESAFEDAYVEVILRDISLNGSTYELTGPWVRISDFDSPRSAVTTTSDGEWMQRRGNQSFNDAMTYYHLDKNQRYMQSLGFVDETGIQYGPIEVDANGAGGADNSFFRPGTNQLSFGHGCVDDNEDADVILHEYGHAITHSINNQWGGGDARAIGEGFGDYWAGSYSVSTTNGLSYLPALVYTWDGGGPCWPGRYMDKVELEYDPNRSYGAHQRIPGGISDELWATPLFQSLLTLMSMGHPRDNVDKIVLEAQFGLGRGITMRSLAESTVAAAEALFPNEPAYAEVFKEKFQAQKILE